MDDGPNGSSATIRGGSSMGEGLPTRMSLPEVMGDPCASELRQHAEALLRATARSEKLIRSHPSIAEDLESLRESVERCTAAVLGTLAAEAGTPGEGESVSPICGSKGDYRIDRSVAGSGCAASHPLAIRSSGVKQTAARTCPERSTGCSSMGPLWKIRWWCAPAGRGSASILGMLVSRTAGSM